MALPSVLRSVKTQLHSDGIRVSFSIWALFGDNRGLRFSVRQLRLAHFFILGGFVLAKKYMINMGTGALHIVGYCHHTAKVLPVHIKYFNTEEEAYLEFGRKVSPCYLCQKEKEKRMEEEK